MTTPGGCISAANTASLCSLAFEAVRACRMKWPHPTSSRVYGAENPACGDSFSPFLTPRDFAGEARRGRSAFEEPRGSNRPPSSNLPFLASLLDQLSLGAKGRVRPCPAPIYCSNADHQLACSQTVGQGSGGTRPICLFCNRPFVCDTRTEYFEEPDNEPLLPDLSLRHGFCQQSLPTVDPQALYQAVPVPSSRQSDCSSPASSSSSSSSPSASHLLGTSSRDSTGSTPPSTTGSLPALELNPESPAPADPEPADPDIAPNASPAAAAAAADTRSKPFTCQLGRCGASFPSQKDLVRHHHSQQHAALPSFRCACDKPESRRDNHKRHVEKCKLPHRQPFRCENGHTAETDNRAWVAHLESRGCAPRRGRRRRTARARPRM